MIYHASSVIRGIERCLAVGDLPFGSYQSNSEIALASAIRIMKETGAHAVKLEGGTEVTDSTKNCFCRHSGYGASRVDASIDL